MGGGGLYMWFNLEYTMSHESPSCHKQEKPLGRGFPKTSNLTLEAVLTFILGKSSP